MVDKSAISSSRNNQKNGRLLVVVRCRPLRCRILAYIITIDLLVHDRDSKTENLLNSGDLLLFVIHDVSQNSVGWKAY